LLQGCNSRRQQTKRTAGKQRRHAAAAGSARWAHVPRRRLPQSVALKGCFPQATTATITARTGATLTACAVGS